jgi:serine phosphatase RsbU (regulator of sigma subunit)
VCTRPSGIAFSLLGWLLLYAVNAYGQESFFQFSESMIEEITMEAMLNEESIIYIQDRWKFQAGDDPERARHDYDDSDWEVISTNLTQADLAFIDWNGIGWFRKEFVVDEELTGKPIALLIDRHLGASEIYLNGEKIIELGKFSTDPGQVENYNNRQPVPIVFPNGEVQTLAVRFINPEYVITGRLMGYNGFRFLLGDWNVHQDLTYAFISSWTASNMFYMGMLLAFAIIHFLLFVFYPAERRNFYFSIFVGFLAVLSYIYFRLELSENTFDTLYIFRYLLVTEVLVLTFAARFTHSIDHKFSPFYTDILLLAGLVVSVLVWYFTERMYFIREIFVIILILEILRTIAVMLYKNRSGVWVLGVGLLIFLTALVSTVLININLIEGNVQFVNIAGSGGLILAMSLFLSRDFAVTQKNLESKLREVQVLSEKTLQQERISKEREIEKRLLEAENERKTKELEEARALQMSMLPKKMPTIPGYDMAVFMETATEVGGDYYDYSTGKDGCLILALGDATGHGMKAGIMVAAAKSYFHSLVHESDSLTMLKRMSNGLHNMNMKLMYMGLMLVRCNGNTFDIATAGMPPVLIYRSHQKKIDRITLKGLPLGSHVEFPYKNKKVQLDKGDVMLMMSDGLMELFDANREMLGISKIENILKSSNGYSANDIIQHLSQMIKTWTGGKEPEDDITLLVIKIPE